MKPQWLLCVSKYIEKGLKCCVCVLINPPWERELVAIVFCEQACIFHAIWILEARRQLYITAVETKYGLIVACKFVATTELTCIVENEVSVVFFGKV